METAQRRQTISKLSRIPGYSGGGFLDGLKRAVGLAPAETMREKFAREDAERAAKNPPKQDPAPAPAPATGVYAGRDGAGGNSMTRREKEAGLAKGGKLKPSMAKAAMQTYASGGLTGAIEKKVSDYISGTPAYARGGTMGKRSFADGGWSALVDHGPSNGVNTLLARGGEIKPGMGSKLKGPGTSTSDDIPAEVVDTGEPIKVATGERIVSKKQDQFLQTVAKERGFKSVDAMFEDATGIPVGPTLKYDNDGDEKTAQRGANDGDGDEPIKHAGLGAMLDSAKRAVGLAPAETMREKFAREDAERAAKNPPKPAPAPEQATAPVTNISGYAGNSSLAAREKAAGLARGGEVSRNMARQRLAKLPSGPKKKEVRVSAKPMVQKRVDRSTEQEVEEGADEFDVQTQIANSVGNAPEGSDVRTVYRAAPGYAGYSSGGLMGTIEKEVSSYIKGTPAYAAGGVIDEDAVDRINAMASKVQQSGEALPSLAQIGAASAPRNAAMATPAMQEDPVSQTPIGDAPAPKVVPVATESGSAPPPAAPAMIPAGPSAATRLRGMDGKDAGSGVTQFNLPGKLPLFTNRTDAAGMADNENLISRDPDGIANMDNQRAMQGIQDRQDAADSARARMAQYNAEVAGAKAINKSQDDLRLQDAALKGNLGAQKILAGNQTDATTRRAQDVLREGNLLSADVNRYTADSNAGVQRGRNANEQEKLRREELKANAELKQKARIDQLDNLIINGNPMQRKMAATQKAMIMGKGADGGEGKPLNEGQAKSLAYGSRMMSANQTLDQLAKAEKFYSTPGANGIAGGIVNWGNTKQGQQLDQAKRDFINATLRRESGAVIADSEFANANSQYFPQFGDSDEVIAQKRENRLIAQRGVLADVPDAENRVAKVLQPTEANTQAQYDALPKGALYTVNGEVRRKK